jgi:hypothetical protein
LTIIEKGCPCLNIGTFVCVRSAKDGVGFDKGMKTWEKIAFITLVSHDYFIYIYIYIYIYIHYFLPEFSSHIK